MKTPINNGILQSDLDFAGFDALNLNLASYISEYAIVITNPPYNAVGDDSTDNTAAIQAAIDAAEAAGGGLVIISAGIFRTGALTFPKTVSIAGVSEFASVLKANAAGVLLTYTGTDLFDFSNYFVTLGAPTLSNLTLDGAATGTDGLFLTEFDFAQVRDVMVKNFTGKGFRIDGGVNPRFDNCRSHHNAYGWHFVKVANSTVWGPGNMLPPNLAIIQNCAAMFNTIRGIHFQDGDGIFIIGTDVESNGTNGNASTGGVYVAADSNNATTGLVMDRCWMEAQTGGSHVEIADAPYLTLHSIRDTVFLDFVADNLGHCIILGGGGADINQLDVTMSASMPSRSVVRDIYGTGANTILTRGPGYYFTEAGTFGRTLTMLGYNATANQFQGYDGSSWITFAP